MNIILTNIAHMKYFKEIIGVVVLMVSNLVWAIGTISSDINWPAPSRVAVIENYDVNGKVNTMSYVITAEKGYDGIVLMFSDFRVKNGDTFLNVDKMVQSMLQPDLLVSNAGSPIRAFDFDDYQAAQYKLFHGNEAEGSVQYYSEEFVALTRKMVFSRWCSMVCIWKGVSLSVKQREPVSLGVSVENFIPLHLKNNGDMTVFVDYDKINGKKQPALNLSVNLSARIHPSEAMSYLQSIGAGQQEDIPVDGPVTDLAIKSSRRVVVDAGSGLPLRIETTYQMDAPPASGGLTKGYGFSRRFSLKWLSISK